MRKPILASLIIAFVLAPFLTLGNTVETSAFVTEAKSAGFEARTIFKGNHYYKRHVTLTNEDIFSYRFALDESAIYKMLNNDGTVSPVQRHWNKLPGASDCGTMDSIINGAMFSWRAHPDGYLEVAAYANNNRQHIFAGTTDYVPMFILTKADLAEFNPIDYRITFTERSYEFEASAKLKSGRTIDYHASLPRACTEKNLTKNTVLFYFGGKAPAPHDVTGYYAAAN